MTILLTALVALGPISTSLYIPSMPRLVVEFGTEPELVQRSFTIFMLGFASTQLIYGPLSDRYGRRPVLVGGLLLYIAASLACALSTTIEAFLLARLAQGIGACAGPVIGRAVVRDSFARRDAVRAFAFISTAISLAPALGPLIGGFLEVWLGWQSAFVFLMGYGGLMLWLALTRLDETLPLRDPMATSSLRLLGNYAALLRHRRYVGYLAPGVFGFGGLFAYVSTSPFLFIDRLGLAPDLFGILTISTVSAYATGSYLAGRAQDRISDHAVIRLGLAAIGLGAVLMTMFSIELSVARVIGPMMLFVFGFGLVMPSSTALALHPFPRIAGSASAMMGFLQISVGAAGSLALSVVYNGSAFSLGLTMIGMAALGATGYLLLVAGDTAPEPEEA
ncbi:MAG: multidrug effflux MFS transporter [Rhodospirillales bacterium]|nr:MAG: multidrug effflux MFS transporter [Rhodospirillales bacterium]